MPPATRDDPAAGEAPFIRVRLGELLGQRGMTLTELSARVEVTVVNLSILKNGRTRAIRFSTLARLCDALHCQPGDLLSYEPPAAPTPACRTRPGTFLPGEGPRPAGAQAGRPRSPQPSCAQHARAREARGVPMLRIWVRSGWARRRGRTGR